MKEARLQQKADEGLPGAGVAQGDCLPRVEGNLVGNRNVLCHDYDELSVHIVDSSHCPFKIGELIVCKLYIDIIAF